MSMQERSKNSSLKPELSVSKDSPGGDARKPDADTFHLSATETSWAV